MAFNAQEFSPGPVEQDGICESVVATRSLVNARTIRDAIAGWATARNGAAALVDSGLREVSFAQLLHSISSFTHELRNAGLGHQDRVGLLVPPGIAGGQLVVGLAGSCGLVPINPALTAHEIAETIGVSRLKAIIIPRWLETSARPDILRHGIATFEVLLAPDGGPRLERLTPGPEAAAQALERAPSESDVALLLRSSGTTGAPKLVRVTHGNLVAMADKLRSDRWFRLTSDDRVPCTLPLYYAAGLKTSLLVPLILGQTVFFPPAGKAFDLAAWIHVFKPTYLSVGPASLNAILGQLKLSACALEASSLRYVMCASAYLPEDVRLRAESMLGVPVVEYYALSEAGVMAANPAPPGRIKPGTVGLPAPGELLLVDENERRVAQGAVGQIMISGPTVTPGYEIVDEDSRNGLKGGWLLTGDLGRIDEDGYLSIVGRATEVINRGGEKVFPYEIEKAMLEHPAVLEAAAFGVPHPRLGENVAAVAVLKPGRTVCEQELKAFLSRGLAAFKLPRRVWFVSSLPRGETGKVLRRSLSSNYAPRRRELVEPDDLLEVEIRDLWARLLEVEDIGIDDDFFEIGGDSLLATQMLVEVERLTGKAYPRSELSTLTIRRITEVAASGVTVEPDLITQVKRGSGMPLFFCHGDYFTRGFYAHKLAALLPGDQPVFLLHYYADRLTGCSIEEIAEAYVPAVLEAAPDTPVCIGGWCNGGLTAWHLAHLLRSRGLRVAQLLLLDTLSLNARPGLRRLARFFDGAGSVAPGAAGRFMRNRAMPILWAARRDATGFTGTVQRAAGKTIRGALRHERPAATTFDATRVALRVELLRRLSRAMSRYVPPRMDVDVTCFIAREGRHFDTDPRFWRPLARSVSEVSIPGTHLTSVVSEREALARALGAVLGRAAARHRL